MKGDQRAASLVLESLALELRLIKAHESADDGSLRLGKLGELLLRSHRRTRRRQEKYEATIRAERERAAG